VELKVKTYSQLSATLLLQSKSLLVTCVHLLPLH